MRRRFPKRGAFAKAFWLAVLLSGAAVSARADVFEPFQIPLYIFNIGTTEEPSYKVGIRLQIQNVNDGGGPVWRMYEFDTGGTGFFAFPYASAGNSTGDYAINYASGNALTGNALNTGITFENMSGGAGAQVTTDIVQITSAFSPDSGNSLNSWTTLLPDTPPLETYFYGDFGMGLGKVEATVSPASNPAMYAVIPQLVGAENNGFIIHLGDVPNPNAALGTYGEISTGWIQVGLTASQADVASWEDAVAMVAPSGDLFPNSGQPVYTEILSEGTLRLTGLDPMAAGIVYDTGAPNTEVHPVGSDTGLETEIVDALDTEGTRLKLTGDLAVGAVDSEILDYDVEGISGLNKAGISNQNVIDSPGLYVNTGITAFFGQDVVFNLEGGFVGFQSVPEPSTWMLMGLGGLVLIRRLFRSC